MSILLIQGPHRDAAAVAAAQRVAAVHAAWLVPAVCADAAQIVARLRQGARDDADLVLLDSGELPAWELAVHGARSCAALDALGHAYIEVHDASVQALEPLLHPRHAPLLTVIANGALADSHAIAPGVAQRRHCRRASPPGSARAGSAATARRATRWPCRSRSTTWTAMVRRRCPRRHLSARHYLADDGPRASASVWPGARWRTPGPRAGALDPQRHGVDSAQIRIRRAGRLSRNARARRRNIC